MKAGRSVFGVISDTESHQGIAGAIFQILGGNGEMLEQTASLEDGSYHLTVDGDKNVPIAVTAGGYRAVQGNVYFGTKLEVEYSVSLSRVAGLSIQVDNKTGREPIKTLVTVMDIASEKIVHEMEYENGYYTLDELREGPYLVTATSDDRLTSVSVRALAGSTAQLTLKPFARLHVQLLRDSRPLNGEYRYIYKSSSGEETISSWEHFEKDPIMIENLIAGNYVVEARAGSFWNEFHSFGKTNDHISRTHEISLMDGETRFVTVQMTTSGTLRGKIHFPPRIAGKPGMLLIQKLYKDEDGVKDFSAMGHPFDKNGEFIFDELPEGEFEVFLQSVDGDVSFFSGIQIEDNGDEALEFDMAYSQKQTDGGVALQMPRAGYTDEEFAQFSPEEQAKKGKEMLDRVMEWQKALREQEEWQKTNREEAAQSAGDFMDDTLGEEAE